RCPPAAAARRAVARPGPGGGLHGVRRPHRDRQAHRHPGGRAEHRPGAEELHPRLRHGGRPDRHERGQRRAPGSSGHARRLPRRARRPVRRVRGRGHRGRGHRGRGCQAVAKLAHRVFFSFASVTDPARHRDYNQWHQLDHRPENLLLDGVRWGERWVRTPDCIAASQVTDDRLADVHYVNLYWFATPADRSIVEWQELAERSFQWGRRPEGEWATRPLMGFFSTVKGYAAPRVQVSADALPFRPNLGVVATVTRVADPHGPAAARRFAWHDQVAIPALLADPG